MLIHIVCWKYRDDISEEIRERHRSELKSLKREIPEALDLQVGKDVLHLDRSYDTGLVGKFSSPGSLAIYNDHPAHQRVVAIGREISAHVVSVDFIAEDEAVSE